jgi:arylformamidase
LTIYDITLPIDSTLACWPGDAPYRLEPTATIREGSTVNLHSISMSVHTGTHADSPYHFKENGLPEDEIPLEVYIGAAVVIDVVGRKTIEIGDITSHDFRRSPRVLFKTGAWPDPTVFPEWVPVLAADVPSYLKEQGVILVGLDVPSVDALDSKDLPIHHALAENGIHILESLYLKDVPPGYYELIALPLKLVGADGAPVRAILRTVE